jgi:class 3 adenylate cyclase
MTKGTPHQLFVAESTHSRLKDPAPDLAYVGEFEVRGRTAKVKLWSLPDTAPASADGDRATAETESAYDRS